MKNRIIAMLYVLIGVGVFMAYEAFIQEGSVYSKLLFGIACVFAMHKWQKN